MCSPPRTRLRLDRRQDVPLEQVEHGGAGLRIVVAPSGYGDGETEARHEMEPLTAAPLGSDPGDVAASDLRRAGPPEIAEASTPARIDRARRHRLQIGFGHDLPAVPTAAIQDELAEL